MTAGIPDILASKGFREKYSNDFHHNFTLDEVIQYVADLQKEMGCDSSIHCFYPGTNYYYSNTGYLIAAKIAEKVSGDSFTNLMKLFLSDVKSKSGAKDIFYYQTNLPTTIINRMINGYYEYLPDQVFNIPTGTNVTTATLSVGAPAGGIVSSTHDMVLAVHTLLTDKLLPYSKMAELNRFVCTNDDSNADICIPGQEVTLDVPGVDVYGFGTSAENDSDLGKIWGYQGSFIGYRSSYIWVKSEDIIIGVTANSAGGKSDNLSSLALQLYQIVKSDKRNFPSNMSNS
jgi:D-alanyl-D-alanine carboxypeptidase